MLAWLVNIFFPSYEERYWKWPAAIWRITNLNELSVLEIRINLITKTTLVGEGGGGCYSSSPTSFVTLTGLIIRSLKKLDRCLKTVEQKNPIYWSPSLEILGFRATRKLARHVCFESVFPTGVFFNVPISQHVPLYPGRQEQPLLVGVPEFWQLSLLH